MNELPGEPDAWGELDSNDTLTGRIQADNEHSPEQTLTLREWFELIYPDQRTKLPVQIWTQYA